MMNAEQRESNKNIIQKNEEGSPEKQNQVQNKVIQEVNS
jgi:hypothetical protein